MIDLDFINKPVPPWLYYCSSEISIATDLSWKIAREHRHDLHVSLLRGNKMRNWQLLFNEIAATLQFPYYFGDNLNALDECITDLEWLNAQGYLLVILGADDILADCDEADFKALMDHLITAACVWAKPIRDGQTWDRDERPFHVLLHAEYRKEGVLRARLERTGLDVPKTIIV